MGIILRLDASISKAISIVNDVDIDTLCAITVIVTTLTIIPNSENIKVGFSGLNDLYAKLLKGCLPFGQCRTPPNYNISRPATIPQPVFFILSHHCLPQK